MIKVKKQRIIASCTKRKLENKGVFNSGIYQAIKTEHILYRAEQDKNYSPKPIDKDIVLFPRKINGKFALSHCIQIVYFDNFANLTKDFWKNYLENLPDYIVMNPKVRFEINYIGVSYPPIETDDGWLLIYYCVQETTKGNTYSVKAALLQIDKPEIEISRLDIPLFSRSKPWKNKGIDDPIVFPTSNSMLDNNLYIYYGAANENVAVAKLDFKELLMKLRIQAIKKVEEETKETIWETVNKLNHD